MNTLQLLEQDLMAYQDEEDLEKDLPELINMKTEPLNSNSAGESNISFLSSTPHRPNEIEIEEVAEIEEVIVQNNKQPEEIIEEITSLPAVQENIETSNSLAISDLQASDEKEQPKIVHCDDLPQTQIQAKTSTSKQASQKSSARKNIKEKKTQEVVPENLQEEVMSIIDDQKKIKNLPVTEATKRLILTKYYRGTDHPDIARFKEFEKKPTALLYELFASVFREKSAFEFDAPVVGPKGANQYTAYYILNRERLASGTGSSKQTAKGVASFRALQILAPSLAERCRVGGFVIENEEPVINGAKTKIASEKIPTVENVSQKRTASEKVAAIIEKPSQKATASVEKVVTEKVIIETQKANNSKRFTENKEVLEDMENLLETIAQEEEELPKKVISPPQIDQTDHEFFQSLRDVPTQENKKNPDLEEFEQMMMMDLFLEESKEQNQTDKPQKTDVSPVPQKKNPLPLPQKKIIPLNPSKGSLQKSKPSDLSDIKCDPIHGLRINMKLLSPSTQGNNDVLAEMKGRCREKGINKLIEVLAEILKKDPKTRIDPKAPKHPEIRNALKFYCSNTIFTKLYMLHCLVNNQEAAASLQIMTLYFESECFVYLYSTELEQTFMSKSNSLVFSIEMAKYFLIYELYSKCFTVAEIIETMKTKLRKPKENTTLKQTNPLPEPTFYAPPQNQQETTSFYQKEKPIYHPVYRGNSQSYYSTTAKSSASTSIGSLNSAKSNGTAANNNNTTKLSTVNEDRYYNKENHLGLNKNNDNKNINKNNTRKKSKEDEDGLVEIIEPTEAKGIRLRNANTRKPNEKGQSTKVLAEIEDALDDIFSSSSESDDDVKVVKNKKLVLAKKPVQKSGVKDLMLEDLDDLESVF